jgi:hypothetical protein
MSHYTLEDLIALWKREELTVEQMVGQLVQALAAQEQRLHALERRVPEEPTQGSGLRSQESGVKGARTKH